MLRLVLRSWLMWVGVIGVLICSDPVDYAMCRFVREHTPWLDSIFYWSLPWVYWTSIVSVVFGSALIAVIASRANQRVRGGWLVCGTLLGTFLGRVLGQEVYGGIRDGGATYAESVFQSTLLGGAIGLVVGLLADLQSARVSRIADGK
jgi:hypothetical protein